MSLEGLRHILAFEDLGADIDVGGFEPHLALLNPLLRHTLQFIESFLAIAGLMASGLRLTAHPIEFSAIEIIGSRYLCTLVVDALLALFQIVGVVASIGVYGAVVEFEDE